MAFDYDQAIARVPRWIAVLGLMGTAVAVRLGGMAWAGSFFVGSVGAWINFRLLEKAVDKLGELAKAAPVTGRRPSGAAMFIQFGFFILGAVVILKVSGLNVVAALCGVLVCPAAVLVEIFYELLTYGHS